jgi:hypothetical protein
LRFNIQFLIVDVQNFLFFRSSSLEKTELPCICQFSSEETGVAKVRRFIPTWNFQLEIFAITQPAVVVLIGAYAV